MPSVLSLTHRWSLPVLPRWLVIWSYPWAFLLSLWRDPALVGLSPCFIYQTCQCRGLHHCSLTSLLESRLASFAGESLKVTVKQNSALLIYLVLVNHANVDWRPQSSGSRSRLVRSWWKDRSLAITRAPALVTDSFGVCCLPHFAAYSFLTLHHQRPLEKNFVEVKNRERNYQNGRSGGRSQNRTLPAKMGELTGMSDWFVIKSSVYFSDLSIDYF